MNRRNQKSAKRNINSSTTLRVVPCSILRLGESCHFRLSVNGRRTVRYLVVAMVLLSVWLGNAGNLIAQNVSARISSREAWVGSPIVLQLQITNAKDYTLPEAFEVDGCDVRTAGAPSQSSQITIINGRRSESRSITMQYLITPRREGNFQIPVLEIVVDGETKTLQPIEFVATKSETGELLFVEVEGKQDTVYVGEPLELNLKIWIKPFADREKQIKLDEGHMWQMISGQTSWGTFAERLQELAENRQRPAGETVLRKDAEGREGEYYLYEIEATVYPNKPGKIDASDLQMVVDDPEALGRSRDPFDRLFEGRSSLIKGMMGDDFFSSPFGRRLSVSKSRPIVAEANVNSTEVLAVPAANRPADYRGAVGSYRIVAEAEPTNISAGDPITLRIGILGDGPMELVQAPPLHEIESLTSDFQVTDQSLAGFVQNETKVFVTTIRPRDETVDQIPAIPFSFFDPDKEAYQTVYTKPIDIDVEKADALDLDTIVGGNANRDRAIVEKTESPSSNGTAVDSMASIDLRNDLSLSILQNEKRLARQWWWYFAIIPPICWATIAVGKILIAMPRNMSALKSAKSQAASGIRNADNEAKLSNTLRQYVAKRTKTDCPSHKHAVGKLREYGDYEVAANLESLFEKLNTETVSLNEANSDIGLAETKQESLALLDSMEKVFGNSRRRSAVKSGTNKRRNTGRRNINASIFWFICIFSASTATAVEITNANMTSILNEANLAYRTAQDLVASEPAQAQETFAIAANRYQLLVDEGVRNSQLFLNLANAWHQCGEETKAIVNYQRALWMNPDNAIARKNLIEIQPTKTADEESEFASAVSNFDFSRLGQVVVDGASFVGWNIVAIIFSIASVLFWLLLALKLLCPKWKTMRWSIIPLLLLLLSSVAFYQYEQQKENLAVVVNDTVELKSGDGAEFPSEEKLNSASGTVVNVIGQRANWMNVKLASGQTGWLPATALEKIAL